MNSQMKRYVGQGLEGSQAQELGCLSPSGMWICSSVQLSKLHTFGIFIETSSCRHDQLLTQFPAPFLSPANGK